MILQSLADVLSYPIIIQLTCILITSALAFLLFSIRLSQFSTSDPKPELLPYIPAQGSEIESRVSNVETGLFIKNFPEFDILTNRFGIEAVIWFEYNPVTTSLDTIKEFTFQKGLISHKSEPTTKMIGENLFTRFDVTVEFSSPLDFHLFPLDDRRIFLVLTNTFVGPNEVRYKATPNAFEISSGIYTGGFIYVDKDVDIGYLKEELEIADPTKIVTNPAVIFSIDFAKSGIRKLLLIMLPQFVIFFTSAFALVLHPAKHESTIMGLSFGSLSALLAYRFVIDRLAPDVGYSTLNDYFYYVVTALVATILLLTLSRVNTGQELPINLVIVLYGVLNLSLYYLLFWWKGEAK